MTSFLYPIRFKCDLDFGERQALAPVRTLGQFAFLMVVLGLLMPTLLVAYSFLHRQEPFEQHEILEAEERLKGKGASA